MTRRECLDRLGPSLGAAALIVLVLPLSGCDQADHAATSAAEAAIAPSTATESAPDLESQMRAMAKSLERENVVLRKAGREWEKIDDADRAEFWAALVEQPRRRSDQGIARSKSDVGCECVRLV